MYDQFFSSRARDLQPVEIREVMNMIAGEEVISLAAGWPNPDVFPVKELGDMVARCLADRGKETLQYGPTKGLPSLRTAIANHLDGDGARGLTADNVLVTSGSQQALYLLANALVDDHDELIVGSPTYIAALTAFGSTSSPTYVTAPLDEQGLRIDVLEDKLAETNPKFAYVVPSFQNPTGTTLNKRRRRRLLDLAEEHNFLVIEDHPYAELRYDGPSISPLIGMDSDRVIHVGTVSKTVAPGLRVGWIAANSQLIDKLELLKQPVDLHTSTFTQGIVEEFITSDFMNPHLEAVREVYSDKLQIALDALGHHMPSSVQWSEPSGGMFLWLELPEAIDTKALLPDAIENGVAYVPGHAFYPTTPQTNTLRLNFTYVNDDDLQEGIDRLAQTIRASG